MIKNVLVHINHIGTYPMISLLLFVLVFVGSILWALSLKKTEISILRNMPLDDSKGDHRHE